MVYYSRRLESHIHTQILLFCLFTGPSHFDLSVSRWVGYLSLFLPVMVLVFCFLHFFLFFLQYQVKFIILSYSVMFIHSVNYLYILWTLRNFIVECKVKRCQTLNFGLHWCNVTCLLHETQMQLTDSQKWHIDKKKIVWNVDCTHKE